MLAACSSQMILWPLTESWGEKVSCVLGYKEWSWSFLAEVRDGMGNGLNVKDFCCFYQVLVYFLDFFFICYMP